MTLLELSQVQVHYGAICALNGVSFKVDEGEIVTLIGSNGAGKTTTLRTISGLIRPRRGQVRLAGKRIDQTPANEVVRGITGLRRGSRLPGMTRDFHGCGARRVDRNVDPWPRH